MGQASDHAGPRAESHAGARPSASVFAYRRVTVHPRVLSAGVGGLLTICHPRTRHRRQLFFLCRACDRGSRCRSQPCARRTASAHDAPDDRMSDHRDGPRMISPFCPALPGVASIVPGETRGFAMDSVLLSGARLLLRSRGAPGRRAHGEKRDGGICLPPPRERTRRRATGRTWGASRRSRRTPAPTRQRPDRSPRGEVGEEPRLVPPAAPWLRVRLTSGSRENSGQ